MTIQVENVTTRQEGEALLSDFNLEISSDTAYVITGNDPEAATSLIRIILGLDLPEKGRVRLLGDYKYSQVNAGVVFAEDRLCEDFTAAVNVAMVNKRLSPRVAQEELDKLLPPETADQPVRALTPSWRRLVCLVRAMIIPSDVVLMDQPFARMEEADRTKAIHYLLDNRSSTPILLVSDRTDGLSWCKQVDIHTGIPLSM